VGTIELAGWETAKWIDAKGEDMGY
jgi:hypothetical protein